MLSRAAVGRQAARALRPQCQLSTRGYASPASFQYQAGDVGGIKTASRDLQGPVTTLAIVAKAGTRYQTLPGLAEGLDRYAFKSTERRSTLRIQRESELLGSELVSYHSNENLVVGAKFLREDLPYFVELLSEVATQTKFQRHVVNEEIIPIVELGHKKVLADTLALAESSAHALAFHRGLGEPVISTSSNFKQYITSDALAEYAASAYSKPNFAVVANGAEHGELTKWVNEFFTDIPAQSAQELKSEQSKYYGGEERIAHASANSYVIAFPGSSSPTGAFYKPEVSILAALLGGQSTIKWSPGFSLLAKATADAPLLRVDTKSQIYTDAGLLSVTLHGASSDIRKSLPKVVEAIKSVASNLSEEEFRKAKALAKFKELEFGSSPQAAIELTGAGLVRDSKPYQIDEVAKLVDSVSIDKVKQFAKEILENKASVSAVGDLYQLPYAEEIGIKV